jgi:hypothetical protein
MKTKKRELDTHTHICFEIGEHGHLFINRRGFMYMQECHVRERKCSHDCPHFSEDNLISRNDDPYLELVCTGRKIRGTWRDERPKGKL